MFIPIYFIVFVVAFIVAILVTSVVIMKRLEKQVIYFQNHANKVCKDYKAELERKVSVCRICPHGKAEE